MAHGFLFFRGGKGRLGVIAHPRRACSAALSSSGRAARELKNLAAACCEEKAIDTIICAKRYYYTFMNEMKFFHPQGKKTYL